MIHEEIVDYNTFLKIVGSQEWLPTDILEAHKLTDKTIPELFEQVNKNNIHISVIYNDAEVLSVIALDFCNQLTYFNTVHVKKHLRGYLLFLRQILKGYVKERSYLTVWSLKEYVTTTKKLRFLGFRQTIREFRRIKWVAQVKQ